VEGERTSRLDPSFEFPGFAKFPRKLPELLSRDDLTFYEFGLLAFLLAASNHRTHRWTGSLRSLQDLVRWPHGVDHLRKTLHALRDEGWIAFTSRPGQRTPYELQLTQQLRATGVRTKKFAAEVTSDSGRGLRAEEALGERPSASVQPRSLLGHQEGEVEEETDLDPDFKERERGLDTQRSETGDEEIPF
jgi:hypothetical protein